MKPPPAGTQRTGLTLIETLVALVLLSGVAVATAALLRSVSDVHGGVTPELRWAMHAERALLCVADDAISGDRQSAEQNLIVSDGRFIVRTRGRAPDGTVSRISVRFVLDTSTGRFMREAQALDGRDRPIGQLHTSMLLGMVDAFRIDPIQSAEAQQRGIEPPLGYLLELRAGDTTVRRMVRP